MGEGDNPDQLEATRVDLGDDLLEKTAVIQAPPAVASPPGHAHSASPPAVQITDPQDAYESARILLSEGFQEEAKHLLRRILMEDSSHAGAKAKLAEIHEFELKQLLEGRPSTHPRRLTQPPVEPRLRLEEIDTEAVARLLEKDLNLTEPPLRLVSDAAGETRFLANLRTTFRGAAAAQKIDAGVAFLEMGLYSAAALLFGEAAQSGERGAEANLLLAQTQFRAGRLSAAELALDAVGASGEDSDSMIALETRYWSARVLEERGREPDAMTWYREVIRLDPTHRDSIDRLRKLQLRAERR